MMSTATQWEDKCGRRRCKRPFKRLRREVAKRIISSPFWINKAINEFSFVLSFREISKELLMQADDIN